MQALIDADDALAPDAVLAVAVATEVLRLAADYVEGGPVPPVVAVIGPHGRAYRLPTGR